MVENWKVINKKANASTLAYYFTLNFCVNFKLNKLQNVAAELKSQIYQFDT